MIYYYMFLKEAIKAFYERWYSLYTKMAMTIDMA